MIGGTGNQVADNYVFSNNSAYGIETVWSSGAEIKNNRPLLLLQSINVEPAAIKSTGNVGETIENNDVECYNRGTGKYMQNSSSNTIKCNDVISDVEGLGININSEQQSIIGNEFKAPIDLKIRSIVGEQHHEGNKFYGGGNGKGNVIAIGLTVEQIGASKFFVDEDNDNHLPEMRIPNGDQWFEHEDAVDYECIGTAGPTWVPFSGGNPNDLCAYWNILKATKNTNPELFFIKLFHLLKYSKYKSSFILPNCIKLDSVFQTLCGITKLVNINTALTNLSISKIDATNLSALQMQLINKTTHQGELLAINQLKTEMEVKMIEYNTAKSNNELKLDSLKNELNLINCTQVIVQKWKEVMKLYIDFLKNNGKVSSQNMAATLSYSADCSDLYGDAVHLARAMARTFDQTNFEVNDNCLENTTPRLEQNRLDRLRSRLLPNPSTGFINIELGNFSGYIVLKSIDGRMIEKKVVNNSSLEAFDLSGSPGIYLFELISLTGEKSMHKVIIIE